jgi:cell division protein FtsW (lipid II flippase)
MSGGLRRSLTDLACRALQATLPPRLQSWGWAVRCEAAEIPNDTKALMFVLDGFCGLMPRALILHLLHPFASLIGAVTLGLMYMAIAEAPVRYLAINLGALVVGLILIALLGRTVFARRKWASGSIAMMALALLATALLGNDVDGVVRWVRLGGLPVQPSLILLPAMLVAFARCRDGLATAGMIAAAAALAIQPDRGMAGMLAAGLAVLAIMRTDWHVTTSLGAAIAGFAVTIARADTLSTTPYVDQILYSSFNVHFAAGAAVLCGSVLLIVPAIIGLWRDPANRRIYVVFGTVWVVTIVAAALGNYPTPIVGYGGSAIIGYALSLLVLPTRAGANARDRTAACDEADTPRLDRRLCVSLA